MRLSTLVIIFFGSVCSVLAEEEPSLHVAIPSSSVYNIGEKKAIFCNGSNLVEPLQWISPSNEVVEPKSVRNNRVYVERRQHAGSPSGRIGLIIFSAKFEDSGNWTCKSGDVSKTIDIFVGEKVILNTSESISEDEGKSVRLNCVAKGIPTPEVFWYKNTTPIEEGRKYKIHKISRDYNTQLEIRNLDHSDSAEYVCKVTQGRLLSYTDKRVQLSVLHKPILVTGDDQTPVTTKAKVEEVFAIANEIKVIRCSAIANPLPEYHWTRIKKNGYEEELKPDDEYHKLQKDKNELIQPISVKQGENDQYSELTITMLDPSYTGQYKCTAKNVKGSVEIIYDVSLGNKPNPPDGLELISADINDLVFNVTCSNCTLRLDPASPQTKENLEVLGYTFQFVPFSEGYVADWETPTELQVEIEDAENTTFVVGPLPNATTFYVRVASYNAAGNSDWFNVDFTVTTAAATQLLASILLIVIALLFTRY